MFKIIKNFFTSFFSNEQQNNNNSESQSNSEYSKNTNNHRRNNSKSSIFSTTETQEESLNLEKENEKIEFIINEGIFKKTNFYNKQLIKDILNDETKPIRATKAIKNSIIGNYQTDKISKISHYETHVESYTKEQEKINSYNYRT